MSATSTVTRQNALPAKQPDFWKRYSPRGECPLSFTGSVLLHIPVVIVLFFGGLFWVSSYDSEHNKPVLLDIVGVQPGGDGLGEIGGAAPGKDSAGGARKERVGKSDPRDSLPDLPPLDEIKPPTLKPVIDLPPDDVEPTKDGDPFRELAKQRAAAQKALDREIYNPNAKSGVAGFKGGGSKGPPGGGGGGATGPGVGPKGKHLSEQRRHELKWEIRASEDGDIHLKKLQALKVILFIELASKPGFAWRYDLSRPTANKEWVQFRDDPNKVRWQNRNPKEMQALKNILSLPEVPVCSVIYLPKDLEADMARRELKHQERQEWEIYKTIWDLREQGGVYDSEPFIVRQILVEEVMGKKGH